MADQADEEKVVLSKVSKMLGYNPVGMLDLLHILSHPEVIEDTRRYLDSKEKSA